MQTAKKGIFHTIHVLDDKTFNYHLIYSPTTSDGKLLFNPKVDKSEHITCAPLNRSELNIQNQTAHTQCKYTSNGGTITTVLQNATTTILRPIIIPGYPDEKKCNAQIKEYYEKREKAVEFVRNPKTTHKLAKRAEVNWKINGGDLNECPELDYFKGSPQYMESQ